MNNEKLKKKLKIKKTRPQNSIIGQKSTQKVKRIGC